MNTKDPREAFNLLLWEVRGFVKNIIQESVAEAEKYSMRLEVSDNMIKILIYNSETQEMVGQCYELEKFLKLCKEKKIEFQLNNDVRKLVLKSQEKSNRRLQWI